MKKIIALLWMSLIVTTNLYAATNGKLEVRGSADIDGERVILDTGLIVDYFSNDVIQTQTITATANSFTNITVPTNAKAILIDVGDSRSLALKGVTGDKGISLDSTVPVLMPLSRDISTTLGITSRSASDQNLRVFFF